MLPDQQGKSDKKFLVLLIFISAVANFCFLEYNNRLIQNSNPSNIAKNAQSIVHGQTVFSVDNEYYTSPVENYLDGKGWKRGHGVSKGDYFRRVPGYSIVYLFFTGIFPEPTAHLLLKICQLLLFLSTIPAIYYLCKQISGIPGSRIATSIYALTPFVSSWTYYTLTESISPALVIFYFFYLYKAVKATTINQKTNYYLVSSVFLTFGILTRPYIAIAGLALFIFSFRDLIWIQRKNAFRWLYSVCLIPLLLIGTWTIRNYRLSGDFVPLEKAFYPQSVDRMKPEFRGLFTFVKCWGEDGYNLTGYHEPMYWAAMKGDTGSKYIKNILDQWPPEIINEYRYDTLFNTLKQHQEVLYGYRSYVTTPLPMPDQYLNTQLDMEKKYDKFIKQYKKNHLLKYWVITPAIYLKRMVLHSHTSNLYFFQEENRQKKYVNLYRYLLLMVHLSLYVTLALNFFLMKGWANRLVFVYIPILFVIFFTFFHREIEQRYMLPVLPVLIAGSAFCIDRVARFIMIIVRRKTVQTNG